MSDIQWVHSEEVQIKSNSHLSSILKDFIAKAFNDKPELNAAEHLHIETGSSYYDHAKKYFSRKDVKVSPLVRSITLIDSADVLRIGIGEK